MIRSNRQIIGDRKIFQNIARHLRPLQLIGDPDQIVSTPVSIIQFNKNWKLQMSRLFDSFCSLYQLTNNKIDQLQKRLIDVDKLINRVKAIMKMKNKQQQNIFSFSNSPNGKHLTTSPERSFDNEKRISNYSTGTKAKQLSIDSVQVFKNNQDKSQYINIEINSLRQQIVHLREMINSVHNKNHQIDSYKYHQKTSIFQPKIGLMQNQKQYIYTHPKQCGYSQQVQISRYKAIIAQFQKQQEILRIKAKKSDQYRMMLQKIKMWLKKLKQEELPSYLPCQAYKIKEQLNRIFKFNDLIVQQFKSPLKCHPYDHDEMLMQFEGQNDKN